MITKKIVSSSSLDIAFERFLDVLGMWVDECISELADELPNNNHDQGTFTVSWKPYILARKAKSPLQFMKKLRDDIKSHFEQEGLWKHGYWKEQEAHHGTEHFELFIGKLWEIDPDDPETIRQMLDAAEHFGNWVKNIPDWFSWKDGLFYSFLLGTEKVGLNGKNIFNMPDHFRFINICVYAYQMTNDKKYIKLATCFADNWTRAILDNNSLPLGLTAEGPIYTLKNIKTDNYLKYVGQVRDIELEIDRAENFLASGVIDTFLYLGKETGNLKYRLTAEKLLDVLVNALSDHSAGCAVDMVRKYRNLTHDYRYDNHILEVYNDLDPFSFQTIGLEPEIKRNKRPSGIGKRSDMPSWYENNKRARHNPILLSIVAEIKNDKKIAIRSLDIARTYFELAREVYPAGHNHGCSARSVSAIARGHGRENNSGVVTAVLVPLLKKYNYL